MTDALSDDLKDSVAQAEDLLDSPSTDGPGARERLQSKAREVRDRLNVALSDLGAKAEEQYTRAEASVKQGLEHTESKIKERPFMWGSAGLWGKAAVGRRWPQSVGSWVVVVWVIATRIPRAARARPGLSA